MPKGPRYQGFHRGVGDESNKPVLEILLGGEGTETYARALHIASADDADTDWNISANTHPTMYVHSSTTPSTDYLSVGGHDGTTATIDVVGGTALNLDIAGTTITALGTTELAVTGNVRLGAIETFGTTEPTSWVVMKSGTQPDGAITTSGGIGCDGTTVQKIIAAGTVNNVET